MVTSAQPAQMPGPSILRPHLWQKLSFISLKLSSNPSELRIMFRSSIVFMLSLLRTNLPRSGSLTQSGDRPEIGPGFHGGNAENFGEFKKVLASHDSAHTSCWSVLSWPAGCFIKLADLDSPGRDFISHAHINSSRYLNLRY